MTAPSIQIAWAPHTRIRGYDGVREHVDHAYQIGPIEDILRDVYATDAHLVPYVMPGWTSQPRINKPGLGAWIDAHGEPQIQCFFADLDNPGHARWTPESEALAIAGYVGNPAFAHAGVYHTAHGARIVQPLATPIGVSRVEPCLAAWLESLEKTGLCVDWACRDWTRHYRLPSVRRDGADYTASHLDLSRMAPIDLPQIRLPIETQEQKSGAKSPTKRRLSSPRPRSWSTDLDGDRIALCERIASRVRDVGDGRHGLYLALSGALISVRTPLDIVPHMCLRIATLAGDDKAHARENDAKSTVNRHILGQPHTGFRRLREVWPDVADAVEQIEGDAIAPVTECTREGAQDELRRALSADEPLVIVAADCGAGKTQAAIASAKERADRGLKTAISVDKNALARQIAADPQIKGRVKRIYGPLSVVDDLGRPVCRYPAQAEALSGAQSVRAVLCDGAGGVPCSYRDTCPAYAPHEGPDDALITVGPHALMSALHAASGGQRGLLVIDEPPDIVDTIGLTLADVQDAIDSADLYFYGAWALVPTLMVIERIMQTRAKKGGAARKLAGALREYAERVDVDPETLAHYRAECGDTSDMLDLSAARELLTTPVPRVSSAAAWSLRSDAEIARRVGASSRVYRLIYAATLDPRARYRVTRARGQTHIAITMRHDMMHRAMQSTGSVAILGADAADDAAAIGSIAAHEPAVISVSMPDGAPVTRTQICVRSARSDWMRAGHVIPAPSLIACLRDAIERTRDQQAGVITYRRLALILRAIREEPGALDELRAMRQPMDTLDHLTREIPELASWPAKIGHFGAVRGLDDWTDHDVIVTLGDPRPALDAMTDREAYLDRPPDSASARVTALARAELEQAHGRLRAPWRAQAGACVHYGMLRPRGSRWTSCARVMPRRTRSGAPSSAALLRRARERMTMRALARAIAVSESYLHRCLRADRVPARIDQLLTERILQ